VKPARFADAVTSGTSGHWQACARDGSLCALHVIRLRMPRPFAFLAALPWPVPLAAGALGFVACRWGLAWIFGRSGDAFSVAISRAASAGAFDACGWTLLGLGAAVALLAHLHARAARRERRRRQASFDAMRLPLALEPACPRCEGPMFLRAHDAAGRRHWVCTRRPDCGGSVAA
jgi:hypothetical protein